MFSVRLFVIIGVILLFFLYPASYGVWRRTRCELLVLNVGMVKYFAPQPIGQSVNAWEYRVFSPLLVVEVWIHGGSRANMRYSLVRGSWIPYPALPNGKSSHAPPPQEQP